jgi:hypothetical protein
MVFSLWNGPEVEVDERDSLDRFSATREKMFRRGAMVKSSLTSPLEKTRAETISSSKKVSK